MKIKVPMTFGIAMFLLAGCATTTEYGRKIGSWVGQGVDSLVSTLGIPSSTEPLADGGKIVSYEQKVEPLAHPVDASSTPSSEATPQATPVRSEAIPNLPTDTRVVSCTTRYRADSSGVIRSWTLDGEGCKANEQAPTAKK